MSEATEPPRWVCSSARPSSNIEPTLPLDRTGDEGLQLGDEPGVDRVRQRVLAVEHARARGLQERSRLPAELDGDDVVVGAVADRGGVAVEARQVQVEALDPR